MTAKLNFKNMLAPEWTVCVYSGRQRGELHDHFACVVENKQDAIDKKLAYYEMCAKRTGQWENWGNGPNYIVCKSNAEALNLARYRLGKGPAVYE